MSQPTSLPTRGADDVLYILDLASWARAIAAVAKPEFGPPGAGGAVVRIEVINGVVGRFVRFTETVNPRWLVVCADDPEAAPIRRDIWPAYKAKRPPKPPEYIAQFRTVIDVLRLHQLPVLLGGRLEADDYIAAVVKRARVLGLRSVIVSRDEDLWQLVADDVTALAWDNDPAKRRITGPHDVREAYGVPPALLADLLALAGDKDEAPGIDLCGHKKAAEILTRWGSLEQVLAHASWLPPKSKLRANMLAQGDQARLSRELVRLREDAPIVASLDEMRFGWDASAAEQINACYDRLGMTRYAGIGSLPKMPISAAVRAREADRAAGEELSIPGMGPVVIPDGRHAHYAEIARRYGSPTAAACAYQPFEEEASPAPTVGAPTPPDDALPLSVLAPGAAPTPLAQLDMFSL